MAPAPGDVRLRQDRWCCPIQRAAMYTLLLTFKGGTKGGAVYDDAAAAEHTGTGRRASGVDGGSGAREAAAAPGKEAPETSRSFGGALWLRQQIGQRGMSQDLNVNTLEFGKSSLPFPLVVLKSRQYIVVHFKINH